MHRLLDEPRIASLATVLGPQRAKAIVSGVLADERLRLRENRSAHDVERDALDALEREASRGLIGVVNATGVLLHTNLGRAPLANEALREIDAIARGYSNLEYDLDAGARGSRHARVSALVCEATGAEDALVVNNCAAAMLLVLDTFARSSNGLAREVIVARDQLIEIGGGFRLPDVLTRSGARLVEVGTTNRSYLHDYERALSPRTALLLRSHRSNFTLDGFVADVAPRDLATLGARVGVPTLEDLGSGALFDLAEYGLPHERTPAEALADGLDLVAFSGDKLLGGPQAGIIAGKRAAVARLRANPLLRAVRVDKLTLAALGATLRLAVRPRERERIPLFRMLAQPLDALRERAERVRAVLDPLRSPLAVEVVASEGLVGGGSLSHARVASISLAVRGARDLAATLRRARPPIVAREDGDAVLLDLRTIAPEDDAHVRETLRASVGG